MKKVLVFICFLMISTGVTAQLDTIIHDGQARTYILHVPPGYDEDSSHPLVINMHGLGSNAAQQQFYSQFNLVADTADIIVAYPNGLDNTWNIAFDFGTDDVGFIAALIDTLSSEYNIDASRIYATGMSMGGFMSHRLGCQLNDKIAAIASVTGTLAYPGCDPGRPFPVMQIHGTADSTVPYLLVPPTMNVWISQNDCQDTTTIDLPDIDTTDQCTVTKSIYSPCDDDVEVILYTVNGGGHTWPGAPIEIGITNYDIDASVEIWNFFRQYVLPEYVGVFAVSEPADRLHIYPQPAYDGVTIGLPVMVNEMAEIRIFDLSGRMVSLESRLLNQKVRMKRNGLLPGIYIVEISSASYYARGKLIFR